jgi:serine/threonine-protein kinase HipA
MNKRTLHVFTVGRPIGALTRSDVERDTLLFSYRRDARPEDAVSLTMPIRIDQYDSISGLLPIFDMNLPEGALRERLRLQFAKVIPHFDDLDLLTIVGASQIGRLRYATQPELDATVPVQDLDEILTYQGSADLFAHLLDRFATHSGISGVQPKVLVRDITAPERLTFQGATHIVKTFDPAEYAELAANELICTRGAAMAGIDAAHVRLSDNRRFLVVDRFDLTPEGAYLGIEDFCVLNGRRAHGRYDGSYEGVAKRISEFVSESSLARAREQFALQVAYACAIGNGDAHLKNFAVLYRHPEDLVSLAPAYDMVSTLTYQPRDTLALTMNGSKRFPDHVRLVQFVRNVTGGSRENATRLLEQAATGVEAALEQAEHYGRAHADARAFVERLSQVLRAGLTRLR